MDKDLIIKGMRAPKARFALFLLFLISGFIILLVSPAAHVLSPHEFAKFVLRQGSLAPLVFLLIYTIRPLILFPASILAIASGVAFGPVFGEVLSTVGATMGALLAFFISKYMGKDFVDMMVSGRGIEKYEEKLKKHGLKIMFLLRLIPVVPFDVVNYTAGLTRVRTFDFIVGSFLGLIPATFVYVYIGATMTSILSFNFLLAVSLFILLALGSVLLLKKYT